MLHLCFIEPQSFLENTAITVFDWAGIQRKSVSLLVVQNHPTSEPDVTTTQSICFGSCLYPSKTTKKNVLVEKQRKK